MLFMNLCSRHIIKDLSTSFHTKLFSSKFARRFSIFTILFIATRDIKISLILTAAFVIIFLNLLNEKSDYCVLPQSFRTLDVNKDGVISNEEIEYAYNILKKAGKLPSMQKTNTNTHLERVNTKDINKIKVKDNYIFRFKWGKKT